MERPTAIKWAKGFAIAHIVLLVSLCFLDFFVFAASFSLFFAAAETSEILFSTEVLSGFFAAIFALLAISRRSRNWAMASLVLYTYVLSILSVPSLFAIAIFVCFLQKKSRVYLRLFPSK